MTKPTPAEMVAAYHLIKRQLMAKHGDIEVTGAYAAALEHLITNVIPDEIDFWEANGSERGAE